MPFTKVFNYKSSSTVAFFFPPLNRGQDGDSGSVQCSSRATVMTAADVSKSTCIRAANPPSRAPPSILASFFRRRHQWRQPSTPVNCVLLYIHKVSYPYTSVCTQIILRLAVTSSWIPTLGPRAIICIALCGPQVHSLSSEPCSILPNSHS